MKSVYTRIVSTATNILSTVSAAMLVALMVIGSIDVIGRYFFGRPIPGCYSISELLLLGIVFFAWPYTQSIDGNVKIDAFFILFRPRIQSAVGAISSLIAIGIFGIMAWQSALKAIESVESQEFVDVIDIPVYPFQFFVTVGVIVLCLQLIVDLIHYLKSDKGVPDWNQSQ
ncbi:MAG: TRAP transporter small permease [Deltaproteobacteria bacterium]|nr:TRAP transporter small permease [Deltaproteobacteria bacterium]